MAHHYQVFKNLDPEKNPRNLEGNSPMEFVHIARCAAPGGPVDARHIKGLGKNYDTVGDFLAACDAAGFLAKHGDAAYNEDLEPITGDDGSADEPDPETGDDRPARSPRKKK